MPNLSSLLRQLHGQVAERWNSPAGVDVSVSLPAIAKRVERAKNMVLYRQARYLQIAIRNSIKRYRGLPSIPGQPPKDRHNQKLGGKSRMKDIRFERQGDSVKVGPHVYDGGTDTPGILDKGGTVDQMLYRDGEPWFRQRFTMEPRPYTQPAFERSRAKLAAIAENALHKLTGGERKAG